MSFCDECWEGHGCTCRERKEIAELKAEVERLPSWEEFRSLQGTYQFLSTENLELMNKLETHRAFIRSSLEIGNKWSEFLKSQTGGR